MPAILDVLIGLSFVFLLFSLVVTAANEIWLSFLDRRAHFLQEGLHELLQEENTFKAPNCVETFLAQVMGWKLRLTQGPMVKKICEHGLVNALSRHGKAGLPSYISPGAFVAAMLDHICPANMTDVPRTIADVRKGISALPDNKLRQSLAALLEIARNDADATKTEMQKYQAALEKWFNDSMDRVTGWYKRYAQTWLFILGLVLAVAGNVDAIHITQALYGDPKLREAVLAQAETYVNEQQGNGAAGTTQAKSPQEGMESYKKAVGVLRGTGIPMGWASEVMPDMGFTEFRQTKNWLTIRYGLLLSAVCGWLITALGASLGAPFWFDTLQRFINIRANRGAPEEKDLATKK
ncbi:MAG: hypothetical protein QM796_01530 [Chthoniobacteraceae bacterium]